MKSNLLYLGFQSIIRFNLLMSDTTISASPGRLGALNMLILFLHNELTEALDDGTPAYYNSNILGRYMKKNYGNFGSDN